MKAQIVLWVVCCVLFGGISTAMVTAPNHSIKLRVRLAVIAIAAAAAALPFAVRLISFRLVCADMFVGCVGLWYIAYNGYRLTDPAFLDGGNYFQSPDEDADQEDLARRITDLKEEKQAMNFNRYGRNESTNSRYFAMLCTMSLAAVVFLFAAIFYPEAGPGTNVQPPADDVPQAVPQAKPQAEIPVSAPAAKPAQAHAHHHHHSHK